MFSSSTLRVLALVAVIAPVAGCQAMFGDDQTSIGEQRLATSAPVASKQRLGDDGYPLLGAFPGTAAPQLTDAEVTSDSSRFNGLAAQRSASSGATDYDAKIARAEALRTQQAAEVEAAMAKKPNSAKPTRPTPADVLKQIESGT